VRDAVVVVRDLSATDKRLAAYLVADGTLDVQSLAHRTERAPSGLHGAVALHVPACTAADAKWKNRSQGFAGTGGAADRSGGAVIAPRTEMECKLADIWRKLLGVETVGIDDSFFRPGRTFRCSLLQAQARIAATFGQEIPIVELLQHPTIAGVARLLGDKGDEAAPEASAEAQVLDDAERQKLLVEWNRTELEYPREACIHELFEAQVERMPDAVAAILEVKKLLIVN
jgi:hypothetical protein